MSVELPFLLPHLKNVLANPQGKNYPLVETRSLRLVMWYISGKVYRWKKFQAMLPNLSQIQGQKTSNYKLAWGQWTKRQVNPFVKDLWITFLVSCLKNLIKDYYSVEPWILLDLIFQQIMSTLMISLWESIQKFVHVYLIKDFHNLDIFLYGMWRYFYWIWGLTSTPIHHLVMQTHNSLSFDHSL